MQFLIGTANTTDNEQFAVGTTERGYYHVRVRNPGSSSFYLRTSTMTTGSSASTGYIVYATSVSHEFIMGPGDKVFAYTTGSTVAVHLHVWE